MDIEGKQRLNIVALLLNHFWPQTYKSRFSSAHHAVWKYHCFCYLFRKRQFCCCLPLLWLLIALSGSPHLLCNAKQSQSGMLRPSRGRLLTQCECCVASTIVAAVQKRRYWNIHTASWEMLEVLLFSFCFFCPVFVSCRLFPRLGFLSFSCTLDKKHFQTGVS